MEPARLIDELLALPDDGWEEWLCRHAARLSLAVVAECKQRSDQRIKDDTEQAERLTRAALAVARQLPAEPLAWALANWARGNWAAYQEPKQAVDCYLTALPAYVQAADYLAVGRLYSNLVGVYATLGRFAEADQAYSQAKASFARVGDAAVEYQLSCDLTYGFSLLEQGRCREALAINEAAIALAERVQLFEAFAEAKINQALILACLGRIDEVVGLLLASRATLAAMPQPPALTLARIDLNLGNYYSAIGRLQPAFATFKRALTGFQKVPMDYAATLFKEAGLLARLGAWWAARRAYEQARSIFSVEGLQQYAARAGLAGAKIRRDRDPSEIDAMLAGVLDQCAELPVEAADARLEQVWLALDRGHLDVASAKLAADLPPDAPPKLHVKWLRLAGQLAKLRGDRAMALAMWQRALAQSRAAALIWQQREIYAELGRFFASSNAKAATEHLETAARIDDALRAELSIKELIADFQAQRDDVLPVLARIAADHQQPERALCAAWRAKGSAIADLIARRAGQLPQFANPEIAALHQQIVRLRWEAAYYQQRDEEAKVAERRHELAQLEAQIYQLRLHAMDLAGGAAVSVTVDPATVAARMDADLLIEYLACDNDLLACCLDRHGQITTTWLGSLETVKHLCQKLEAHQNLVLALLPAQRAAKLLATLPILRKLYDLLLAPLLLPPAGKLLIAPCAPLHYVPFAALWDGAHYGYERYLIEQTPSGMLVSMPAPSGETGPPLVVGASAEGQLGAVEREITAVQAALPDARVSVDDPAAVALLRALPQPPRILHLSAHTELGTEATIFAGLQLAGRMFPIADCYNRNLAGTELAVLSGCTTAHGIDTGGAVLALQSALLIAGARRILVSLWQINDDATAVFMRHFYQALNAGQSPPEALRSAQQALRADPACVHPALWAAFVVVWQVGLI